MFFLTALKSGVSANNTITGTENTFGTKNDSTYSDQQFKGTTMKSWISAYAAKPTFFPLRIAHELPDQLRLIKKFQQASTPRRRSQKVHRLLMDSVSDVLVLTTLLMMMVIMTTFTLWIRRQHSLDFVRSATIQYRRNVDSLSKSELSETKGFLPALALRKGIYNRGMLKELTNVFSRLGSSAPTRTPEICFPDDFMPTDKKKETPCVRIKLLTQEEVAREEF